MGDDVKRTINLGVVIIDSSMKYINETWKYLRDTNHKVFRAMNDKINIEIEKRAFIERAREITEKKVGEIRK